MTTKRPLREITCRICQSAHATRSPASITCSATCAALMRERGKARESSEATESRIKARVLVTEDGCWAWTGRKISTGYGVVSVHGRKQLVHRAMYELRVGQIPEGLVVDHQCLNRACCNPDHLRTVTRRQNNQRIQANEGSTSRYRGVSWSKSEGKWIAQAAIEGQGRRAGAFDDEWDGADCRQPDLFGGEL